ncbi:flagellar hook assembly protein FlgD [Roseococcus sp. DSY-14]|uniref:flagellar hook assembly protein FlgD n=1 Tax=Roseococcus sp. DSY-14 TaxID=3369650 RepID=UPI00387B232A
MSTTISGAAGAAASAASSQRARLTANFDTFLTLLTTQLRNQDPTNAMDTEKMTQQLVSFAGVEQQLALNDNMERLISLQQGAQLVSAAPLMGRLLEVESDSLSLQGGTAALRLPAATAAARQAEVTIEDAQGRTLRRATVNLGSAPQDWSWDGRSGNGAQQRDGAYRFTVRGLGADGTETALAATVLGRATTLQRADGAVTLGLGGLNVDFSRLRSIVGG